MIENASQALDGVEAKGHRRFGIPALGKRADTG